MNRFRSRLQRPFSYASWNLTYVLIGVNVGIFLLSLFIDTLYHRSVFAPAFGLSFAGVIGMGETSPIPALWQFITYFFTHDSRGISHIFFNMLTLWMFGLPLERRIGSREFLLFYILCGFTAGLLHFLVEGIAFGIGIAARNPTALWFSAVPLIGASGAIFAVLIAYAVYYSESVLYLFGLIPIKARNAILIFGGIELFSLLFVKTGSTQVSNLTHLGGILSAILYLKIRKNINAFKILIPPR